MAEETTVRKADDDSSAIAAARLSAGVSQQCTGYLPLGPMSLNVNLPIRRRHTIKLQSVLPRLGLIVCGADIGVAAAFGECAHGSSGDGPLVAVTAVVWQ